MHLARHAWIQTYSNGVDKIHIVGHVDIDTADMAGADDLNRKNRDRTLLLEPGDDVVQRLRTGSAFAVYHQQ